MSCGGQHVSIDDMIPVIAGKSDDNPQKILPQEIIRKEK